MSSDPIVIVAAKRTPMGKFNGCFRTTTTPELGASVLTSIMKEVQTHLQPDQIDAVYMGCVLPAGLGQAPARQAAILSGLPKKVSCVTINKVCGSGMQSVLFAHDNILAGSYSMILAGGMENMSRAPYLLPNERFGQRIGHSTTFDHMMLDGLEDAYERGKSMGVFAEHCSKRYNITRNQQDEFAKNSILRARHAITNHAFISEITPVETQGPKGETIVIDQDEAPFTVDIEKIPKLSPAFSKDGTVTAANSSSISDGAAGVLVMKQSSAQQLSLNPLASIMGYHVHAQEPEWFTTAPIGAITGLLQKLQWDIKDVDLFEINEAFAVVPLVAMQALHIPHDKINVNGGACILGHPLGASGARIIVTLIHALKQRHLKRGIAALCIGGGEATAIAVEIK